MSISPFELRLGNIVDVLNESGYITPDTGYNWTVGEISRGTIGLWKGDKYIEVAPNLLSPITLTEEWLIELSLNYNDVMSMYHHDEIIGYFSAHKEEEGIYLQFGTETETVGGMIKYLHEFQNLFKVLTNKELTIKDVI